MNNVNIYRDTQSNPTLPQEKKKKKRRKKNNRWLDTNASWYGVHG
jgi:hypothetical protein